MLGIGLLKTGFWFCFLVLWLLLHLGSCKASVILLFESYYLVACMQVHLCNLGKIILVVEPPSSKEKWAFSSAHWWVHCQNFSPSSQKWACSQANYLGIKNLRLAKDNKMPGLKLKKKHYGKRLRPSGRKKQAKKKWHLRPITNNALRCRACKNIFQNHDFDGTILLLPLHLYLDFQE